MNAPDHQKNLIKEQKDVLLGLYQENRAHARHHEAQRVTVTSIIIVASVGLVTVMSNDGRLSCADWPLTGSLVIIGVFGTLFTAAQYERICRYTRRAGRYLAALDALLFKDEDEPKKLVGIRENSDKVHEEDLRRLRHLTRGKVILIFWPLTVALIGIVATVYAVAVCFKGPADTGH